VTYQRPLTDRYNYREAYLRAKIIGMLGGRAAEEVVYGNRTTGAENDIEQASRLAQQMVIRWGMSDKLGMVQLAERQNNWIGGPTPLGANPYSEETARLIDEEVSRIIKECHEEAKQLLAAHRASLHALVAALIHRESLDEKEILQVTDLPAAPPLPDRPRMSDVAVEAAREPTND
jgi:cell division protease FtsH